MMSYDGDSVLTSYKSPTDITPAPDDKVVSEPIKPTAKANPKASDVKRDPIDPRPVGCVRLSRQGMHRPEGAMAHAYGHYSIDIPEHTEVLDCHTMTRMSVGRVASRYEFGANLSVQHNGQTWRVETWRERAMRLERALIATQEDMRTGSAVALDDFAGRFGY